MFHAYFPTFPLYNVWDQFIIFRVILQNIYYQVLFNVILIFKGLHQNQLSTVNFCSLKACHTWRSNYLTHNNLDYLIIEVVKFDPNHHKDSVTPTVCGISTQNLLQLVYQHFVHVSVPVLSSMENKGSVQVLSTNLPNLEWPWEIFLLKKETKFSRVPIVYASNFAPVSMLQINSSLFNDEIIHGLTYTFVVIMFLCLIYFWVSI